MPNPNISTQDWYYHSPSKRAPANQHQEPPPPSQIPGLSNVIELPDEMEERRFRRKWIRDTDSQYIQLAKGGGRKNLLTYKDPPGNKSQVGYPRVDWFDHYNPELGPPQDQEPEYLHCSKKMQPRSEAHRVLPEWYVHDLQEEKESQDGNFGADSNTKTKKKILNFDNMSAWERDAKDEEVARNEKRVKFPQLHSKKLTSKHTAYTDPKAFPKRMVRQSNEPSEPVDIRHLLSMGYQKDWFKDQNDKHSDERIKKQMERLKQDEKRTMQMRETMEMRMPKNNARQEEDRDLFKLSRFQKIQPRVESFRT